MGQFQGNPEPHCQGGGENNGNNAEWGEIQVKKKREKAMKDNWFKFETVVARELDRERVVRLVGKQNVGYTFPHIKRHIEGNKQETRRKIRESERK